MIIQTNLGSLRGSSKTSLIGLKRYYAFLGIPFAEPPIGPLRFKEPVPHKGWEGIRDATNCGNDCVHFDFFTNAVIGVEDCLFLNVYAPQQEDDNNKVLKPVMVFFHSGGFETGSGKEDLYSPNYLIDYDIVLITVNYRLHVLRFLNLGIPECPGNVGLKDQVLALKWIRDNIRFFGGDDENVTLFGVSAGAASVHYQMMSPLSKGLFKRCILQSGNALCPWAFSKEPETYAFLLGKKLEYDGPENSLELLNFLRTIPGADIAKAVKSIGVDVDDPVSLGFHFVPSLERIREGAFLPEEPEILLKTANPYPVIIGIDEKEFLLFHHLVFHVGRRALEISKNLEPLVNRLMDYWNLNRKYFEEMLSKIQARYFDNNPNQEYDVLAKNTVDLFSDLTFGASLYRSVNHLICSEVPVFVYQFRFRGDLNLLKIMSPTLDAENTSHADDLPYIFHSQAFSINLNLVRQPRESIVRQNMCYLWTNFARTGNPNGDDVDVKWDPTTIKNPTYLEINDTLTKREGRVDGDSMTFWEGIIEGYQIASGR